MASQNVYGLFFSNNNPNWPPGLIDSLVPALTGKNPDLWVDHCYGFVALDNFNNATNPQNRRTSRKLNCKMSGIFPKLGSAGVDDSEERARVAVRPQLHLSAGQPAASAKTRHGFAILRSTSRTSNGVGSHARDCVRLVIAQRRLRQ
jgi:hypothetical protein